MKRSMEEKYARLFESHQKLKRRVEKLEKRVDENVLAKVRQLAAAQQEWQMRESIIFKAFSLAGMRGDYLEFGVYSGTSLTAAYHACRTVYEQLSGGMWDHSFENPEARKQEFAGQWAKMRFFAFDSFEGMPKSQGVDAVYEVFPEGTYSCSEEDFYRNIVQYGVDRDKVRSVKGFFQQTLTEETRASLGISRASIVHIDSDLYESALLALDFVYPVLQDGSIIIFDEWYQFAGNPMLGERRAFSEWLEKHPELTATEFHKEGCFRNSFVINKPIG